MKKMLKMLIIPGAAAWVLVGCTNTQVAVAPVGPNPASVGAATGYGELEVYSAISGRVAGDDQTWNQHSDYDIYTAHGRRIRQVRNSPGYYSTLPRLVVLRPGKYIVEARSTFALSTRVPVVIKPNEITRVHLDGNWQPDAPAVKLVMAPGGHPVGWRAQ